MHNSDVIKQFSQYRVYIVRVTSLLLCHANYSTCDVISTVDIRMRTESVSNATRSTNGLRRGLAAALYEAAAACSGPDRERVLCSFGGTGYSSSVSFTPLLFLFVDDSLSRAFAHARLSDRLTVEREE